MNSTRFEMLLDMQAKALRKNGMCLRMVGPCDTICNDCADYAEEAHRKSIKREVEQAITLLRSYGFKVEEGDD